MSDPELHRPVIITDGGPWAAHDYACPACQVRKALLNLNSGRFNPCNVCRKDGWELRHRNFGKKGRLDDD